MQNIDGNDNVQILGDGNTIVVNRPFEINKSTHAAEMAMGSPLKTYRIGSSFVEFPLMFFYLLIMIGSSIFIKEYYVYVMIFSALGLFTLWYFLPIKFGSLIGMVHWDKFDRGYKNEILFKDIHKMVWQDKKVHIITFNRDHHNIIFISRSGAEDLFEAFGIYTKLRF